MIYEIAPEKRKGKKGREGKELREGKRKGKEDKTYVKAKHMKCSE